MTENLDEAYPVEERAFHVVKRFDDNGGEQFRAQDRATLSSFPARDRGDAYAMVKSLNAVVRFHATEAVRSAALASQPTHEGEEERARECLADAYEARASMYDTLEQPNAGSNVRAYAAQIRAGYRDKEVVGAMLSFARSEALRDPQRMGQEFEAGESDFPPDAELLRRIVEHPVSHRKQARWVSVMHAFCLGSTYSRQLCRRFGMDPDQVRCRR